MHGAITAWHHRSCYLAQPHFRQALIEYHERCGDKIIVFSDSVPALHEYARKLNRPFIEGKVGQTERMSVLDHFKRHPDVNTIFITKVCASVGCRRNVLAAIAIYHCWLQ